MKNEFDQPTEAGIDLFSQFTVPTSEAAFALPPGLVPSLHSEPVLDDPTISIPPWDALFNWDLKLTEAQEGLRSQKVNRNIAEIAGAILHRFIFALVGGLLAVFDPPCWRTMSKDEELHFVAEVVGRLFPTDAEYLSDHQYREIVSRLRHDPSTRRLDEIPAPDYTCLCCRDYMYDWRSGTCYSHKNSDLRFSNLELDASTIGQCDGTHWEIFLDNLTDGNDALRQRILEMIGVILSGYPSKSFFFMEGESGTGKSQLVNFLRDVLGRNACFALNDISQLGEKWTTSDIFGKLLCLCGDMPDIPLSSKAVGTIKQLTGDDLIRAEPKHKSAFNFENTAKLLFVSNHPLQIQNQYRERALLERLVYIPCQNPVPRERQIPSIHELLYQEAGYIVGLAMEALEELDARNGVFTPLPEDMSSVIIQAPDNERIIKNFVRDCCLLEEGASCFVGSVFEAFRSYCPEANMNAAQFSKSLCRLYPEIARERTSSTRKYSGLRLADHLALGCENPS